jgi:hypothetical protein
MSEFKTPQDQSAQPHGETETPESENETRDLDDMKDELELMAVKMRETTPFMEQEVLENEYRAFLSLFGEALKAAAHKHGWFRTLKSVDWLRRSGVGYWTVVVAKILFGLACAVVFYILFDLLLLPWILQLLKQFGL